MCIVHTSITCPFSLTIRICILLIFVDKTFYCYINCKVYYSSNSNVPHNVYCC